MLKRHILLSISALTLAGSAAAQTTQYTDRAAFLAAAGAVTTETFSSATPTGFTVSTSASPSFANVASGILSVNIEGTTANPGTLTFTFAAPTFAFGADFSSLNNGSPRTYVTVGGTTFNPLPLEPAFLGFVSQTAFTTVTFLNPRTNGSNDSFTVDNLAFSAAAPVAAAVPEPASWAMMIGGFGMVGGAARRRRAQRTTVRFA